MPPASTLSLSLPLIILLGIITAFDAMAIDMYLPAMDTIGKAIGADTGTMQTSLSVFLIGLAAGQLVYGPLADRFGRRIPLMSGVLLFTLASVLVALSSDTTGFMLGRALQGVGGAAGLVIPRAVVSDLFSAREGAKVFSLLMQVMMIGPIAAPPLGGILLATMGWHSIFWMLALIGAATLAAMVPLLPETLAKEARSTGGLSTALSAYGRLIRQKRFFALSLSGSFTMAGLFVYIGSSAFIFTRHFGLSPTAYSLVFAANAIGMVVFGQINMMLLNKWPAGRLLTAGLWLHAAMAALLVLVLLAGLDRLAIIGPVIFLAVVSLSLVFGNITAEVMESAPQETGSASSLFGVMGYVLASGAGATLGLIHNDTLLPPAGMMLACAIIAIAAHRIGRTASQGQTSHLNTTP